MMLSELYTSTQGEGPNTGLPIQFVRFGLCNMRCAGWPCDTPQAIYPDQYRHEWEDYTIEELIDKLEPWPRRLCLTGGEPFLQKGMDEFIHKAIGSGYNVDIFTNGSFDISYDIVESPFVFIIMDWKLMGSKEATTRLEVRKRNARRLGWGATGTSHIKFVVAGQEDLYEAKVWYEAHNNYPNSRIQYWVGAAWGHIEDSEIVDFVLEHQLPWRLNIQTHKMVWAPEARFT